VIHTFIRLLAVGSVLFGFSKLRASTDYSRVMASLPLRFEENRGQAPPAVRFLSRGPNYSFTIRPSRYRLTWTDPRLATTAALETTFVGANARGRLQALEPLPTSTNYLVGDSPRRWHTDVPNYGKVRVNGLYPGIDLVFYGKESTLEYDFVLRPGANSRAIQFEISGANRVYVDGSGDLVLSTVAGDVRWKKPNVYQEADGVRKTIDGRFELAGRRRVRFHVGEYDRGRALVIDPVLAYASYFGSSNNSSGGFELARAIGVDPAGNVYIAGTTASNNLPVTTGVVQTNYGGATAQDHYFVGDVFVAKFTAAGAVSYVTYLGGSGDDTATSLAVDPAGDVYLTGITDSKDFVTTPGVLQPSFKGFGGNLCAMYGDAFVAKLNPSGSKLIYSTYLGGSMDDAGMAIAIDGAGNAYVAGWTLSTDFPVVAAFQSKFGGGNGEPGKPACNGLPATDTGDAFVAKLNPSATALIFSTYLGGSHDDAASTIAVDPSGNVYVGGATLSPNFPATKGALQTIFRGIDRQNAFFNTGDAFVTKFDASGSKLDYSTFLGGRGDDAIAHIVVDKTGTVYAAGSTSSPDFPVTSNAVQGTYSGYVTLPFLIEQNVGDAFVVRLDAAGANLLYSTFLGGSANDAAGGIAVDPSGLIYLVGATDSTDFPVTANAAQPKFAGDDTSTIIDYFPVGDGFFAVIDPNLKTAVYSTYYGALLDEGFAGIAMDTNGNVWITGGTQSSGLTVTQNAFQKSYTGAYVASGSAMQSLLLEFSMAAGAGGPILNSVTNAASNKNAVVSPGMLFVAYGNRFGPSQLQLAAVDKASGLLSATLAGTSVLFDNIPAPLVYLNGTSVAGTVPYELAGKTATQMVIEVEGHRSAPLPVAVAPTAPGVFSVDFSGAGQAVAFNYVNGPSLNSAANPIPKGATMVIYATGEGQTMPAGQDGLFSISVVPKPIAPVSVSIGGVDQPNLQYVGGLPGEAPGVLQINVVVASNTPSGIQPLAIKIGDTSSQPNLSVAVQ
jgi:uncharacterized protein (TIGR03437 family)